MLSKNTIRNASASLKFFPLHFYGFSSHFFSTSTNTKHIAIAPRALARRPTSRTAPIPRASDTLGSSDVVNSVCSLLSNKNHQTPNLDLDHLLKRFKDTLSSDLVLQILMNYRLLGRAKTLEFFSWSGLQMGYRFDETVVEYMADFLGRRKLFDDMKCLLVTVSSHKGRLSCRTFSICIRFLGRQGRVREALCLFEEMEPKFGCKPDNLVFNNMLYALCKKEPTGELIDTALSIFRRIELPDKYSYSNVIIGLCKFGRFGTAIEVFDEMNRAGLVPTRSAVNILIGDLCSLSAKEGAVEQVRVRSTRRPFTVLVPNVNPKSGAIEPAVGIFWAANKLALVPSAFVIVQLISELCRLGQMQEAIKVLKVVEGDKLRCAEECYSVVMRALCEHRHVEEASDLFGRILSQGMKPKLAIYNSIICMLCKIGNLNDAERVFKIMNRKRCAPDHVTYSSLIHAYGETRNWSAAYSLLKEMLSLGMSPHFHLYSLVDKLMREHGQIDLCLKLEMKWEAQILQKLCKHGQLDAAYEKMKSMLEKGFYPPIYVRDSFESAFQKKGKFKIARELLQKIDGVHQHESGTRNSS
ncbi:pentatricopeptide repeat-containing protein At1g77360, mitochondrial-like [Benincasa hispida]|uniref:pentatricopeptide repeat-containing protein At1g77360, mitochondrial-like n=1 Tax=Benincasa hispida TaxID=102211 RepID=UPI001902B1A5|nr:pentatricopeptide repeat-containing protein At1g77360, mitochondrial-like [Benincasa hispida]XP_038875044.1 pentatricopeptide repeat-containing protein At1g77360, mitochondrial-like [Benincasa hispida]XP_038875045.1 pentatricopeptide repeat-containing protein At1g77360, mitochondrial-like [Benincasa hispida]XP_038875047.1 pentatricopeptide repeat-containing protein At1g77360, mitochondrial-like [Benincasa hispida]XP_038875052.1 pentatricopeptide repeat-containing protein At1g77360, mitochond